MRVLPLLMTEFVTPNVKHFYFIKPEDYVYSPGSATEIAINQPGWENVKRPFTFTSINSDQLLELTIKNYPDRHGVTEKLHSLAPRAEILFDEPFDTVSYQKPGIFIAAGAGITPFIAIFRSLKNNNQLTGNTLIFTNKTQTDIILEPELQNMFDSEHLILTLTQEEKPDYYHDRIDRSFLKNHISDFKQSFYVCGPPSFTQSITTELKTLGANPSLINFD